MRDVLYMDVHEDGISMRGFLAPTKKVAARIVKIDLEHHKILLEPFLG
ncbi:MAG: CooT family nickel-binding protein [Deltaproteobacteria bacterium]|jgi:predicted RNA-binding protein|nr:CooT family nickel-binding protein [Deltaproteobacteria bacterium]